MRPSIKSSLGQWLSYIESIHPTEIELGLQRLQAVADKLGLLQHTSIVFTVAGTNGKGTTTAVLAAMAQAAGKTVGWYTSPHLMLFNERIRINNQTVIDQELINAFDVIENARGDISLSYFEYTSLAAFYIFKQHELDVWVLEVGLGGRLDAVNIIEPDVCVVTNIGLDHQGFLGNTLSEIAKEKAGIARPHKPMVLGSDNIPDSLFDVCHQVGAVVYRYGDSHNSKGHVVTWSQGSVANLNGSVPHANAASAIQAFSLAGYSLDESTIEQVLKNIQMPGRLQRVAHQGRDIILDVGHNPHAACYISSQLAGDKFHLLIGMLSDKEANGFIESLAPIIKSLSLVSLSVPRGLTGQQLMEKLSWADVDLYSDVGSFIEHMNQAHPGEPLFIGGSFYTVCSALKYLEKYVGS